LLPTLDQIRHFKYRLLKKHTAGIDERSRVDDIIAERKYQPGIDPNKGFIFASKNGTGTDDDPVSICKLQ